MPTVVLYDVLGFLWRRPCMLEHPLKEIIEGIPKYAPDANPGVVGTTFVRQRTSSLDGAGTRAQGIHEK